MESVTRTKIVQRHRNDPGRRTIRDFGEQWQAFPSNSGYYASQALLADILGPLLPPEALRGCRVADLGSGTGRIVGMLLGAGAEHVTAVEPSQGFEVLQANLAEAGGRVRCLKVTGDQLPPEENLDYVVSIGVIHHIPDPLPVLKAAYAALRPGGRVVIWVYGQEGNRLYLSLANPVRLVAARLPHIVLWLLSWSLLPLLAAYMAICRVLPLPMRDYMRNHLGRLSTQQIVLTIYDQLNPTHAKYYRKDEVFELLATAGFKDIELYHRHGYSWTAIGVKPAA